MSLLVDEHVAKGKVAVAQPRQKTNCWQGAEKTKSKFSRQQVHRMIKSVPWAAVRMWWHNGDGKVLRISWPGILLWPFIFPEAIQRMNGMTSHAWGSQTWSLVLQKFSPYWYSLKGDFRKDSDVILFFFFFKMYSRDTNWAATIYCRNKDLTWLLYLND